MARNKRPVENKPVPEPSESEEEQQQTNNSDESDADTATIPDPKNDADEEDETDEASDADIGSIPDPKPTQSKSESGSESETDSDSDRPTNFTIKPIQSKQQQPPTPVKSPKSGSKRSAEAEAELGSKKKAKVVEEEDEVVKKASVIQRLFSEEDEVALLEGVCEFQAKKGVDPSSDIAKFHDFIKKSIHFDATTNQLKEKIRRLKNKYKTLVRKSGEDPIISKPHDLKVFNLSKKIWGSDSNADVADKPKKKAKENDGNDAGVGRGITLALVAKKQNKVKKRDKAQVKVNNAGADSETDDAAEEEDEEDFSVKFPLCAGGLMEAEGLSDKSRGYWLQNLGLIGKAKLEEYEAKLEKIRWAELELFIQKRDLINEKLRLLRDASKSTQ